MWKYTGGERPPFADAPAPGQESVWDYPRPPRLDKDSRRVIVRSGSVEIADTTGAVRVCETASPPTFYLPPDDVQMDRLVAAPGQSFCEWKGAARYWAVAGSDEPVGWSYPTPSPAFAAIRDYLSFYPGRLECFVGEERVRSQPGGFYGGWLTDEIAGPVKGTPGTGHW